ncbi:xanthine dehydrogenase family protein molybdopterin-binding subunit [Halobacteria archaeon AArc-m2/3/4]|uniref:Xanthine dehydrogenase family protein molybdopterin-binding subunit n=1 Tax=Natronoglomus mannanivorans TaxID=2979990 RepID=A0ABT2Q8D8_9EURY|nr:xanthine dehydrogenase family protein molybdopterin-binding subunit [Halobacteria archaeon AArc-m2/3/4]
MTGPRKGENESEDEAGGIAGPARREDEALLTGRAEYTDDLRDPDAAHLAFVRSEYGHAEIEGIDATAAAELEGVLGVYTWDDVAASESPGVLPSSTGSLDCEVPAHPVLARDRVRYQGQPIAAVVAENRYRARDAVDAVAVDYDPLEAVVDSVEATAEGAPTLFDGAPDNVAATTDQGDREATEDAFDDPENVVDIELENNRLISSALEPRAALAEYDAAEDRFTVTMTSQSPHGHRQKLAHTLGLSERQIRVISPSVGGGFGHKGHHHPGEAMAAWCARDLERPVKWTATRSENYLEGAHGRDHRTTAELAIDDDGAIRGLRVETHANVGGYGLDGGASMPGWYGGLLSSQYRIPAIHCETHAVFTNTAPVHSYRGAGRPEAIYVTERLVDVAARELGIDPVEFRRRNLIEPDQFPYETPVGASYDSGDYERGLEEALELADYDDLRARGRDRDDGRLRGVGVACYTESTGGGFESGVVRVHRDGGVTVSAGTHSHGQGHETTYANLVADVLEIPTDDIDVMEGDSDSIPTGTGTFGSRSTIVGGSAIVESAEAVLAKARRFAADRLEVEPDAVAYGDGEFSVRDGAESGSGSSADTVSFADVAGMAYGWGVPEDMDPGLEETTFYEPDGTAYTFGTHVAVVAIDPETGELELERYVAVDDCGERLEPTIVEGQVHGGVAQGIGQAVSERASYDGDGTLLTNSLDSYAVPRASHLPEIETGQTVTPSPRNPLGVKGIGEAGTIAAPPAVVNAVVDALAHLGVRHVDMPLTDEAIWRAIRDSK